jgi:hypothetical protein
LTRSLYAGYPVSRVPTNTKKFLPTKKSKGKKEINEEKRNFF